MANQNQRSGLSRRTLLKGVAGIAAASVAARGAATAAAEPSRGRYRRQVDVAVIGAGISGLAAARRIAQAGLSVVVLEASERVGGRMVRQQLDTGGYVDLGGQWVGPTQDRILALADELGVERFPWYHEGETVLVYEGTTAEFDGDFPPFNGDPPPLPTEEVSDAENAWSRLESLAATVPPDAPWTAPDALTLDRETVRDWLARTTHTDFARFVFTYAARIGGSGAFEPGEASMLHMAYTQSSSPQAEAPESELFYGAAGQIPLLLAADLGDSVVTGARVWGVEQDGSGVTLHTSLGRYQAQFAIVAIPPTLAGGISYDPPMPPQRIQLTQRIPMGSMIKVNAIYPTAFWRDAGLNGVATSDLRVTQFTADSSPPSGTPGILTSFVTGAVAIDLSRRSAQDLQTAVLDEFVAYFGAEAGNPSQFVEMNWDADPWAGGAFTSFMAPGVWTTYGEALRKPVGRIYWAGTETATRWSGYFDGGVRAGEDAAQAILDQF